LLVILFCALEPLVDQIQLGLWRRVAAQKGMQHIDGISEAYSVDGAEGVAIEVVYNLLHAGVAKPL
jgi:hypothetical protein